MLVFVLLADFYSFCGFCISKVSLKKSDQKIVLIASITILMVCTPLIFISKNLFLFMIICENLFLFARISSYLWSSVRISSFLWESVWTLRICENPFLFMIICENLLAYLLLFTVFLKISKHMNSIVMIMIICWLRMYQFYVFLLWILFICV